MKVAAGASCLPSAHGPVCAAPPGVEVTDHGAGPRHGRFVQAAAEPGWIRC